MKDDFIRIAERLYQANNVLELDRELTAVAAEEPTEAVRILIDFWHHIPWRTTKFRILALLGRSVQVCDPGDRGLWFLLERAAATDDLPMAREAILALGHTRHPVACEQLQHMLTADDGFCNRREAIIALSYAVQRDVSASLTPIAQDAQHNPNLRQAALTCIGRHRYRAFRPILNEILQREYAEEDGRVFNAALLAAGAIGDEDTESLLVHIDTRQRFFADQLRENAITRIRTRRLQSVEDVVQSILDEPADDDLALLERLLPLREYPIAEAREGFFLLAENLATPVSARVRTLLAEPASVADDLDFMVQHQQELPSRLVADLLHNVAAVLTAKQFRTVLAKRAIDWERISSVVAIPQFSFSKIGDQPEDVIVAHINSTPIQAALKPDLAKELSQALMQIVRQHSSIRVQGRALRALGQVGWSHDRIVPFALEMLNKNGRLRRDGISCLGSCPGPEAGRVLAELAAKISSSEPDDFHLIITLLARRGPFDGIDALAATKPPDEGDARLGALRILASNRLDAWRPLVLTALQDPSWTVQLTALAAARLNHDDKILDEVTRFHTVEQTSLCRRSIFATAQSESPTHQRQLMRWLAETVRDPYAIESACTDLLLAPGRDYEGMRPDLATLQAKLVKRRDAASALQAVRELDERIITRSVQEVPASESSESHGLDEGLAAAVPGFEGFSDPMKAAIRNAEATFQSPELFTKAVDRSTIAIELGKAIDILFQERLGIVFTRAGQDQLFVRMQSRIIELELDLKRKPYAELDAWLDLSAFPAETFPRHKLYQIATTIADGRILHNPYRVLDGLRAWVVIVMLFGRKFKNRRQSFEPLLPIKKANPDWVGEMARELNDLQQIRNTSAHRGTLTLDKELTQVRELAFKLLERAASYL